VTAGKTAQAALTPRVVPGPLRIPDNGISLPGSPGCWCAARRRSTRPVPP